MKYYINSTEQIVKDEAYAEYGNKTSYPDYGSALIAFYDKCKNVAADIGKNHTYMTIRIENSLGNIEKSDILGKYIEP